jgi:hypothetical protein
MKIGVIVDGRAEYSSLGVVLQKINTTAEIISQPIKCDIQPYSTAGQIAHVVVKKGLGTLVHRGAEKIVVLVDKENRRDCTIEFVQSIEDEIARRKPVPFAKVEVRVVLKICTYENWLIADTHALIQIPGLIPNPSRIARRIANNRADSVDAQQLLADNVRGGYDKIRHAQAICLHFNPDNAAQNSRSFRKLLQLLEHPDYQRQTKNPVQR